VNPRRVVSKQRRAQLARRRRGLCEACGEPSGGFTLCEHHRSLKRALSKAYGQGKRGALRGHLGGDGTSALPL
jgi:hypothetical protein